MLLLIGLIKVNKFECALGLEPALKLSPVKSVSDNDEQLMRL
jgi:hypothetical protein